MVEITNGFSNITVTRGAFEGIYKHQGYTLVKDYSSLIQDKPGKNVKAKDNNYIAEAEVSKNDNQEETGVFDNSNELLEKPIGQWTKEELRDYADANDISLEGASTTKEVRNIIKDFIDSQK